MLLYLLQTEQTKIKLLRRVREEERRKQLIDLIFARRLNVDCLRGLELQKHTVKCKGHHSPCRRSKLHEFILIVPRNKKII